MSEADTPSPSLTTDQLAVIAYNRMREIAQTFFARVRPGVTLQPTALVHEAYLKLAEQHPEVFASPAHFVSVGARAMRQVLVDHARHRGARKRGGGLCRVTLSDVASTGEQSAVDILILDQGIRELAIVSPRQAQVVEYKFFGGFSMPEIAEATGASLATVERDWRGARAWLKVRLADELESE